MVSTVCQNCGVDFYRSPAFHRNAVKRGSEIKFCSRACTDAARSSGIISAKKRRGANLVCEVCGGGFYRPQSMIAAGKARFCSEPCRLRAHQLKLVGRAGPRPERKNGTDIACRFCGKVRYRRASMISRNIDKTCGDPVCVSAYSRGLWGLAPRDEQTARKPRGQRKARKTNFTAANRRDWLGDRCVRCGSADNLALDHRIPVCAGGQSVKGNAQTLCQPCNNWKAKHVDKPLSRQQPL